MDNRNGLISIETFKDAMGDLGIYLTEDEINHIKECYVRVHICVCMNE